MTRSALDRFVTDMQGDWGPPSSARVAACRGRLETLTRAPPSEPWLAELFRCEPQTAELHRDPRHGFVLLAHTEREGLYRPPHDHGRAWVVYGVRRGEVEMRTFGRIEDAAGSGVRLVQRDSTILRPGQALAYLPGDIHDTRCLSGTALLFRFTERDLKAESLTRYAPPADAWTRGA